MGAMKWSSQAGRLAAACCQLPRGCNLFDAHRSQLGLVLLYLLPLRGRSCTQLLGAPSVGNGWGGLCVGMWGANPDRGRDSFPCHNVLTLMAQQSPLDESSTCSIILKDSVKMARVEVCNSTKVSSTQHSKSGCKVRNIRHCGSSTCSRHYLRHVYQLGPDLPTGPNLPNLDLIYPSSLLVTTLAQS